MSRLPPALVLYFLAPIVGELLSGSAPPTEFFHPFGLIVLPALYGSGALLARELALRWGRRWPSILTLGLAYGILEEGLMVKSFFDPQWPDLGLMATYGRWAGVNWVWSLSLTLYHAVVSIAIPILLVELLFPERRDEPWLGRRGAIGLSILLVLNVLLGLFLMTPYKPPFIPYLLALVAVVVLFRQARRMPSAWGPSGDKRPWKPLWTGLTSFAGILAFFFGSWALPELGAPVWATMSYLILLAWAVWKIMRRASGEGLWYDLGRWPAASGALAFFILLGPLMENDPSRTDNPAGMTLVAIAAALGLIWLRGRIRRRERLSST